MKDLKSVIKKRGNGFCATVPKSILDIFKIGLESKFDVEVKTVKGKIKIILTEV